MRTRPQGARDQSSSVIVLPGVVVVGGGVYGITVHPWVKVLLAAFAGIDASSKPET